MLEPLGFEPKWVFVLPTLFDLSRVYTPCFASVGGNSKNYAFENLKDISQPHFFIRNTVRVALIKRQFEV